ncbi:hypothetical protein ACLVWU_16200 [Bdellovibrio sp. HCB290]|uniref:hypothetical protein n=1 Tax=Bdellovibrio sp. HCB290 TaxID=3394356 RepID=UPI0039B4D5F5
MMKFLSLFATFFISVSAFAGSWKMVANDTVFQNAPMMKIYPINSKEVYSEILVRVTRGTVRITNPMIWLKNKGQQPVWTVQGDYRGPRDAGARFFEDQIIDLRMNLQNLDRNIPANIQIYIR